MTRHREITIATGMQLYFCHPSSPWRRGSNEQTNGLLRSTSRRAPICRSTPRRISAGWPFGSTSILARRSAFGHDGRSTRRSLRRPLDSARSQIGSWVVPSLPFCDVDRALDSYEGTHPPREPRCRPNVRTRLR